MRLTGGPEVGDSWYGEPSTCHVECVRVELRAPPPGETLARVRPVGRELSSTPIHCILPGLDSTWTLPLSLTLTLSLTLALALAFLDEPACPARLDAFLCLPPDDRLPMIMPALAQLALPPANLPLLVRPPISTHDSSKRLEHP